MKAKRGIECRLVAWPALKVFGGAAVALALLLSTGCERPQNGRLQGYLEGEFVYVAAPSAGRLEQVAVERGAQVKNGDLLFALESMPEAAAREEARRRMAEAQANLEDARKGKRPSEIESVTAQLAQAKAALQLSEKELARQEQLARSGGVNTEQDVDRARALRDEDRERASQLAADLATARLGARSDLVTAAEAQLQARQAEQEKAEWDLAQKTQHATRAALVFDTLYRPGDWVPAGKPVVQLLPPENVKLRVFVPEPKLGSLHLGDLVQVWVDGAPGAISGKLSFISPRAEYSPPVIYSRENRAKFVFRVEAEFEPAVAARLHPGQPVDVEFSAAARP